MKDKKLMQTYVYHEDAAFFVSTIERDFGTPAGNVRGKETIVWEIDRETGERWDILYQGGGTAEHLEMCKQLHRSGKYEPEH